MSDASKTEIIWKKLFELDSDSQNFWVNFFTFAKILFQDDTSLTQEQRDINKYNRDKIEKFEKDICVKFSQGDYIPSFYMVQNTIFKLPENGYIKVKNPDGVTKLRKLHLLAEFDKMKSWIYLEAGKMNIRLSSASMNVVKM